MASFLQEQGRGIKIPGPRYWGTTIDDNVGDLIIDRTLSIIEGFGQQTGGARAALEAIPGGKENLERLQAEAEHVVSVIALFAPNSPGVFERGLRAITGGLSPIEAQVFALEEAAGDCSGGGEPTTGEKACAAVAGDRRRAWRRRGSGPGDALNSCLHGGLTAGSAGKRDAIKGLMVRVAEKASQVKGHDRWRDAGAPLTCDAFTAGLPAWP